MIIYGRGTHEHNLLVVEVNRDKADVEGEIRKIENNWFQPPLSYMFGAVVASTAPSLYVVLLENPARNA